MSTSSEPLTLFDLPSQGRCACWSPNVWKTRLVLNYKSIPFRTEWVTHLEIPTRIKELGLSPNEPDKGSPYTVPVVRLEHGNKHEYVMDSDAIAARLESLYPEPSLHLDTGLRQQVAPAMSKFARPLLPVFMPRIGRDVVVESSQPYFQKTRGERFGMPLDQFEREQGGEQAWQAAEPGIKDLAAFLKDHKKDQGPFVLGSEVCYADFVIMSMIESFKRIGDDLYERLIGYDEVFAKLHEACRKWTEKDD